MALPVRRQPPSVSTARSQDTKPPMLRQLPNGKPPPQPKPDVTETSPSPSRRSPNKQVQQWLTNVEREVQDPIPRGPSMLRAQRFWEGRIEAAFRLNGVPRAWGTGDLYKIFSAYGDISMIKLFPPRGGRSREREAKVAFKPPPRDGILQRTEFTFPLGNGFTAKIRCQYDEHSTEVAIHANPARPGRNFKEEMRVEVDQVSFGTLKHDKALVVMQSCTDSPSIFSPPSLSLNLRRRNVELVFGVPIHKAQEDGDVFTSTTPFSICIRLTEIRRALEIKAGDGTSSLVLCVESPPFVYRRLEDVLATHQGDDWYDHMAWQRTTSIPYASAANNKPVKLVDSTSIVDVGRWLAYKVDLSEESSGSATYRELREAMFEYNVKLERVEDLEVSANTASQVWSWLDQPAESPTTAPSSSLLSDLRLLQNGSSQLTFAVRYQLEVCLSQGVIHECNVTGPEFMQQLTNMDQEQAIKLLEKAVDRKERYPDPTDLLRSHHLFGKSTKLKQIPRHCTKVRSATLTPTTIYINSPTLETSNRVIRKYREHEDRFLRVKFTDERYKGFLMGSTDNSMDDLYAHIKRAMQQGIDIGDRHYEFLAFGNSQFRERGAYFFSPTATLNASDMRAWMGNFAKINVVAKYCSRVGQCFSTTRPINSGSVKVETIPDVERNGYCFTDGVGKISPYLAQLIAEEFNIPDPIVNYPSVFQFRLAGFKGVLAVDPSIKGGPIAQFRPSQNKFPAQYLGLEIIRFSQHSTAFLNQQLILVLTALGVRGDVFLQKMKSQISDIERAMHDRYLALTLLQKTIDFNQTTLSLASIIYDGFMETEEPFLISCLRLWKSWLLKGLKEKAKIFIDDGAFVLGCTDETGTLQGHFKKNVGKVTDPSRLPQIFLQVPTADNRNVYKVVHGVCAIARNPSLHPGDIRVVLAVDVPALHHLKNCVVLPQTGDRDLANMCSGGDLDGDDYLVMWDNAMMPREWDHPPMDYTGPDPIVADGPVTVTDMAEFFVNHLKNDNLPRIATAHRYWADRYAEGVKLDQCLALANLHSMAVDYAKSGVPAIMDKELRTQAWPHWAENTHVNKKKVYHSRSILGQLYDTVQRADFVPAWELPFDNRILNAYTPTDLTSNLLTSAREIKTSYDESIQRVMAQYAVQTEFEVWTAFVLDHSQDVGDYKFAETLGEIFDGIKKQHIDLCCEKAGTTPKERDWTKLGPFIAACYTITAQELQVALAETKETKTVGGRPVPLRELNPTSMPFISFPWIFARDLGILARQGKGGVWEAGVTGNGSSQPAGLKSKLKGQRDRQRAYDLLGLDFKLEELPEVRLGEETYRGGDVVDLLGVGGAEEEGEVQAEGDVRGSHSGSDKHDVVGERGRGGEREEPVIRADGEISVRDDESGGGGTKEIETGDGGHGEFELKKDAEETRGGEEAEGEDSTDKDEDGEGEQVQIDFGMQRSGFDKLAAITRK
ncbi:hypothetical protein MBLNU230_g6728t1 [Neophaeotheca triangularis]